MPASDRDVQRLLGGLPTRRLLGLDLVDASPNLVAQDLAARPAQAPFSYLVTPNADHFVRLRREGASLRDWYSDAGALLLDSRVVSRLARIVGLAAPRVTTGSDLTEYLLRNCIGNDEPVTLVGTTIRAAECLRARFGLRALQHFAPPFGFENDPPTVERCVRFVCDHPARFVFLACGSPRQELLAHAILRSGRATGIGLCIGVAIDQVGGAERRAPGWVRHGGLEWLWRALREPRRLGMRYLRDLAIIPALMRERHHAGGDAVAAMIEPSAQR